MTESAETKGLLRVSNLAFYHFMPLDHLEDLRSKLKECGNAFDLKGSVIVSPEGVNGSISALREDAEQFKKFMVEELKWDSIEIKETYSYRIAFKKFLVKIKKEIIPLGDPTIQPHELTGKRISPADLKEWLDQGKDILLLDTRNTYEIELGAFKDAVDLNLRTFRNFPEKLRTLPEDHKKKPMVMYCTGGVRCEKASVVALREGFQEVYQLDGGILKYFEQCGHAHYQGSCFVFDERVAIDSQLQEVEGHPEAYAKSRI